MPVYLLALDQGTTSSKALIIDDKGCIIARETREFEQYYPKPGWVEHDPIEIWESQLFAARKAIETANISPADIASVGITNQRETTVVWNRRTGEPLYNAIVWQCRRTSERCTTLTKHGLGEEIQRKTGLVVDAYFSATKVEWILNNVPGARESADNGDLLFGTIDTWLIWKLTNGKMHATDYSNASRTMLYNIRTLEWDKEILGELGIPVSMLPEVRPTSGNFGKVDKRLLGHEVPIFGVAGDQQAALFGQCCFSHGMVKATYGTGSFILMNTGENPVISKTGLLTTIAWGLGDKVCYALEGSTFIAGAVIQWLRDELQIIQNAEESEQLARKVEDTGGVYFVPAFVGLGAPHWDMYARGTIVGLTRGTNRSHITRAALESIAFQVSDMVNAMLQDAKTSLQRLRVDGGASQNNFLMQFQADILGSSVTRPSEFETTALGAAYLAGLGAGVFDSLDALEKLWQLNREFEPEMPTSTSETQKKQWHRAVERSKGWSIKDSSLRLDSDA